MSNKPKTILILGGCGYIGNVLINKLFQAKTRYKDRYTFGDALLYSDIDYNTIINASIENQQHMVDFDNLIVYDNLMYNQVVLTEHCYRSDFKFVKGDVRDHDKLLPYIQQADVIIILSALVGFPTCEKNKQMALEVNYESVQYVLDNTTDAQKILFPATNSLYGTTVGNEECTEETPLSEPISYYAYTKNLAEKALIESKRAICLRLATVFGVSQRMRLDLLVNDFAIKAFRDGYIVLFEKNNLRNYVHVQDVALTFIYMINKYDEFVGGVYNVGLTEANMSKHDLCLKIKEQLPKFVIKFDDFAEDPDKRNYIVSNKKLESTGWKCYYSLEDGISELLQAYEIINNDLNKLYTNI